MNAASITVPDLVSLSFAQAYRIGTGAGVVVQGVGPDGLPVDIDSERIVVDQEPMAGESLRSGAQLLLRVGRPPDKSGDREPDDPGPWGHAGTPEPDVMHAADASLADDGPPTSQTDPDLVPA